MANYISFHQVCSELGIDAAELHRWIEAGIVRQHDVGFEPAEVRRIWSIVSLQRDLDVNLEGVQIILEMSEQITSLQLALHQTARQLQSAERYRQFQARILEERSGVHEWDIDL